MTSSQTVVKPASSRHVTAVLGPTNTGKTHLAIERMLGHESGMIGLPLRLLAREIYDKIVARIGPKDVALITGEEKIKPERPRYYVCTVEAMPRDVDVAFLAIDEIQLAADPDRGHVFTERLFHARGSGETLLLGAQTMAESIRELIPGANFISRPRLSKLTYSGQKKITRLPSRSAIVAFSANDVYAIAELIRRQRGGAAVVLGALSPRTRNAQVALYQSGDVDFLVATDAVGMGLNLNVDHIAFAGTRKFDGRAHRDLTPGELAQIAGRAGRHLNDGTFGVTSDVEPFDPELINRLENHDFEGIKVLQWRNNQLNFDSIERLKDSLKQTPSHPRLTRTRTADDLEALELACNDARVAQLATAPAAIKRLWEVCQVPDYRKVAPSSHAELVATLYKYIMSDEGVIPEDWFASQVEPADKTDGDIDTLSNRIAHIRTWTFVSNRREWLKDPDHWQARTREIEDRLSDALHDQLTQRFVDKRTSALMKAQDKDSFFAEIEKDGNVLVERHSVGKLEGFRFTPDTATADLHGKAARNAAAKVLVHELAARADRLASAPDTAFSLSREGHVIWENQDIGRLTPTDDPLKPGFTLNADEHLAAADKENITKRLETWISHYIEVRLKPLVEAGKAEDITGLARGIAFRLRENFGVLKREAVAEEIKSLDQEGRAQLRKYGVRFGAHNIYFPLLLKPAASDLLLLLWLLKQGSAHNLTSAAINDAPRQGLTSTLRNQSVPEPFYRAAGFHVCGPRVVRLDMLERLADLIRPLTAWKPTEANSEPPAGAVGGGAFKIRPEMMSIMGCSNDELGLVLEALGFRCEKRPVKKAELSQAQAVVADQEAVASEEASPVSAPGGAANDNSPDEGVSVSAGQVVPEVQGAQIIDLSQHTSGAEAPAAEETGVSLEAVAVETASAETAAKTDEQEFEDIWRFRRPKPKHERAEGEPRPRNADRGERGGDRNRRSHHHNRPRHGAAQGEQATANAEASAEGASQEQRNNRAHGQHQGHAEGRKFDKNRSKPQGQYQRPGQNGQKSADGTRQGAQGGASDTPRYQGKPGGGQHSHHRDRNNDQRGPRGPQGGRHQAKPGYTASASPKKSSGSVDPDSPFAALSQLKERLEKQVQPQD